MPGPGTGVHPVKQIQKAQSPDPPRQHNQSRQDLQEEPEIAWIFKPVESPEEFHLRSPGPLFAVARQVPGYRLPPVPG